MGSLNLFGVLLPSLLGVPVDEVVAELVPLRMDKIFAVESKENMGVLGEIPLAEKFRKVDGEPVICGEIMLF